MLKNRKFVNSLIIMFIVLFLLSACNNNRVEKDQIEALKVEPVLENMKSVVLVKDNRLHAALDLMFKTEIGRRFERQVNELLLFDKIHLVTMNNGHFGESGEGCVVKEGVYFYEGFYIQLNGSLSATMLAISLVHELTHYQSIKINIQNKETQQITVSALEIMAFAKQYQFIKELQHLKLITNEAKFTGKNEMIEQIMEEANALTDNGADQNDDKVVSMLNWFGYSEPELNRFLLQRSEKECQGLVVSDSPSLGN